MSLRGCEATEAISYLADHIEIAALPTGARNDKIIIGTQPLKNPPQPLFKTTRRWREGGRRNRADVDQFIPLITRCTAPG